MHLRDLLDAPKTVARIRQAAQRRVLERYTWDAVTDQYEAYFAELIARDSKTK